MPFLRLYPASHICHGLHVSEDDGADIATETNGANWFPVQFKLHNTPTFELVLLTAAQVPQPPELSDTSVRPSPTSINCPNKVGEFVSPETYGVELHARINIITNTMLIN